MKNKLYKKGLVLGIIVLFIGSCLVPGISGLSGSSKDIEENPVTTTEVSNSATLSLHTFDKTVEKQKKDVEIPVDAANEINSMLEELKQKIVIEPLSDETKSLKISFVDLLEKYDLIPSGLSEEYVFSLLNPSWLNSKQKIPRVRPIFPVLRNFVSRILGVFESLQQFFKMRFGKTASQDIIGDVLPTSPYSQTASAVFCSMGSGGQGAILPLFLLPRPRGIAVWSATDGVTAAAELLSPVGSGFGAEGAQSGLVLGFVGLGLTFAFPGNVVYGFFGYALFTSVSADNIVFYPPNEAPVISDETPADGSLDVPLSLSELSFRISDPEGKLMSFSVTTDPDIGSGSGILKPDGVYSVPVSSLESLTEYTWNVQVSDGQSTNIKDFTFTTEPAAPVVSNPSPEDCVKYVLVSLSELSFHLKDFQGDLMDYTVTTVPDIGSGSGNSVGDGTYTVPIGGLDYSTEYKWYVTATDGVHQTNKEFSFQTEHIMVFDPFDEGWQFRKKITIDYNMVDGDLTSFPVLISTVDVDLRDKAQSDGDDILFMDGPGVANRLCHEIEYFDDSNGELVAWVNIPSLSSDVDTVLYMYYGNSDSYCQQASELVWDSGYLMVQHLNGNSAFTIDDSTFNNNDVTSYGGNPSYHQTGKVGYCVEFDGNSHLAIPKGPWDFEGEVSITWWVDIGSSQGDHEASMATADDGHCNEGWWIEHGTKRDANFHDPGVNVVVSEELSSLSTNTFYYMAITKDSSGNTKWYMNTDDVTGSINFHSGIIGDDNYDLGLGRYVWLDYRHALSGKLDEIRISTITRSADWISTEYQNQNDPLNFLSVGPEESAP